MHAMHSGTLLYYTDSAIGKDRHIGCYCRIDFDRSPSSSGHILRIFLDCTRGLGDGSPPVSFRGKAPVGGLEDEVPQKPKHDFLLEMFSSLKYFIFSFQVHYLSLFLHRDTSDGNFRTEMAALVQLEY